MIKDKKKNIQLLILLSTTIVFGIFLYFFVNWLVFSQMTKDLGRGEEELVQNYQKIVANSPKSAAQLVLDGYGFLQKDKNQMAVIALEKATSLDQQYRDAFVYLGFAYLKNNNNQKALETLEKAEKLDPMNPTTWQLLAVAYQNMGQIEKAKEAENKYKQFATKS
jgi:Tfp pilus assembly protein PilF